MTAMEHLTMLLGEAADQVMSRMVYSLVGFYCLKCL